MPMHWRRSGRAAPRDEPESAIDKLRNVRLSCRLDQHCGTITQDFENPRGEALCLYVHPNDRIGAHLASMLRQFIKGFLASACVNLGVGAEIAAHQGLHAAHNVARGSNGAHSHGVYDTEILHSLEACYVTCCRCHHSVTSPLYLKGTPHYRGAAFREQDSRSLAHGKF